MLAKCAHPACFAQFRYLRQGQLFKVRMPALADGSRGSRVEYFWLCETCAQAFKVVLRNGSVMTVPLYLQLTAGVDASRRSAAA